MSFPPIAIRCSVCLVCCSRECYDRYHPGQCHDRHCVSNMPRPRIIRAEPPDYFTRPSFSSSSDRPRFDYEDDRSYNVAYVSPRSPEERLGKYPPSASRSAKYYEENEDYDRPPRPSGMRRSFSTREPSMPRDRSDYRDYDEPSHRPAMKRSASQRGPSSSHRESKSKSYATRRSSNAGKYEPERESRRSSRSSRPFAEFESYERPRGMPRERPQYHADRPPRTTRSFSSSGSAAPFQYKYASTEDPDGTVLDEVPPEVPMPPSAAPEYEAAYDRMRRRSSKYR